MFQDTSFKNAMATERAKTKYITVYNTLQYFENALSNFQSLHC